MAVLAVCFDNSSGVFHLKNIDSDQIVNGAVISAKIAANAVGNAHLASGEIQAENIKSGSTMPEIVMGGDIMLGAHALRTSGVYDSYAAGLMLIQQGLYTLVLRDHTSGATRDFSVRDYWVGRKILYATTAGEIWTNIGFPPQINYFAFMAAQSGASATGGMAEVARVQGHSGYPYFQLTRAAVLNPSLTPGILTEGHFWYASGLNVLNYYASGATKTLAVSGDVILSGGIGSGQIASWHIADGAIVSAKIASGIIGWPHIGDGAILSGHIGANIIATPHILNQGILSGSIGSGQIGDAHIYPGAVVSAKIGAGEVGTPHIASGLDAARIASGSTLPSIIMGGNLFLGANKLITSNLVIKQIDTNTLGIKDYPAENVYKDWYAGVVGVWNYLAFIGTPRYLKAPESSGGILIIQAYGQDGAGNTETARLVGAYKPYLQATLPVVLNPSVDPTSGLVTGHFWLTSGAELLKVRLSGITKSLAFTPLLSSDIGSGQIGDTHIYPGAITSGKIAANIIATPHILNQGILSGSIAANAIGTPHILDLNITSGKLTAALIASIEAGVADGGVTSAKIASGAVGDAHIYPGSIISAKIGANIIATPHILAGGILSGAIGANVIATPHMANQGILSGSLGANVIATPHIANQGLLSSVFGANIIATPHIANQGILSASIATIIGAAHFYTLPFTSGYVIIGQGSGVTPVYGSPPAGTPGDNTITSAKIASGQVGDGHIYPSAILTDKILDANVTSAKLTSAIISLLGSVADGAITSSKIASGIVGGVHLVDGLITSGKIASGIIGGVHLVNAIITSGYIASGIIGGVHIMDGSIGSTDLADSAVISGKLGSGIVGIPHLQPWASGKVLVGQGTTTTPITKDQLISIAFVLEGFGSSIQTGTKGFIEVPFPGMLNSVRLLGDQSGQINVHIWKTTYCVDAETQCLSREGWKYYWELNKDDIILAYDFSRGHTLWESLQGLFTRDYYGDMVVFGDRLNAWTTPNHRWPVEIGHGRKQVFDKKVVVQSSSLPHHARILRSAPHQSPSSISYSDAFVELAAWYFTEGSLRSSNISVIITQKEGEKAEKIRATMKALGGIYLNDGRKRKPKRKGSRGSMRRMGLSWNEYYRKSGIVFRLNGTFVDSLTRAIVGKDKIPTMEFITSLTEKQLILFLNTAILGDGWFRGQNPMFSQMHKKRMDSFMIIAVLAGWSPSLNKSGKTCSLGSVKRQGQHRSYVNGTPIHIATYKGIVWCPQTISGFWLARRKGKVFITGNSNYPPTSGNTICSSLPPSISGSFKYENTFLSGWDKNITSGDILGFAVAPNASNIQLCTVSLGVYK